MLLRRATLEGIVAGEIDLAFRRWRRPTVKTGGRLRTAVGELDILAVEAIDDAAIDGLSARRAGYPDRDALLDELAARDGQIYRIALHYRGEDPRAALRNDAALDPSTVAALRDRLDRMDARAAGGPWASAVLRTIERSPGRAATDLARELGFERAAFKRNVRKLNELDLTESLEVGYRLSPRGRAFLAATDGER